MIASALMVVTSLTAACSTAAQTNDAGPVQGSTDAAMDARARDDDASDGAIDDRDTRVNDAGRDEADSGESIDASQPGDSNAADAGGTDSNAADAGGSDTGGAVDDVTRVDGGADVTDTGTGVCPMWFADCDGITGNGCERSIASDTANCGACGHVCSGPANATGLCVAGTCQFTCNPGFHDCGGVCRDDFSVLHCGTSCSPCPVSANGRAGCNGTSCGLLCDSQFHNCGGVCVSNSSVATCGSSCTPCPTPANSTSTECVGAVPEYQCVINCSIGFHECRGACVADSESTVTACGPGCVVCRVPANGFARCDAQTCGISCNAGFHPCLGACVPNGADTFCGGSCSPCPVRANSTGTCSGASCGITCTPGYANCNGLVTDGCEQSLDSRYNCGACGNVCAASQVCDRGLCTSNPVDRITAGSRHVCVSRRRGEMYCWGDNASGQLGDGTRTVRSEPLRVPGVTAGIIDAGQQHTCAVDLSAGNTLRCWGRNSGGQLGDGTTIDRLSPIRVGSLVEVVNLAAGDQHTCAQTNGTTTRDIRCWGRGVEGQIGDGAFTSSLTPTRAVTISGMLFDLQDAGENHVCARRRDATNFQCWGAGREGPLGNNREVDQSLPVTALTYGLATQAGSVLRTGAFNTCAVNPSGYLRCWGSNFYGQLGDGTTNYRTTAVVTLGDAVTWSNTMSLGRLHGCAVTAFAPSVRCWGNNSYGQLGDGTTLRRTSWPTASVPGMNSAIALAAGGSFTCALLANSEVWCWGDNSYGQLGRSASTLPSTVPVRVWVP